MLPAKRSADAEAAGAPESLRPRALPGTSVDMLVCQEEEMPLFSDAEALVSALHMEASTTTGEHELCALEVSAVLSPAPARRSATWPPDVKDYKFDLGACTGVRCVDTGEPIPAELVLKARQREITEVVSFKTFHFESADRCRGMKKVKAKWVDRWRERNPASGVCKSRLVAMEIAYDLRADTHAGTPTIAIIRYVISEAASSGFDLMIHDVTCAFLHASMDGEPPLALILPWGMAPEGCLGVLDCALYGTRRASYLWGEKISTEFTKPGTLTRAKGCGQLYFNKEKQLVTVVHGDDFITTGPDASLQWFDTLVRKAFKVKYGIRLGPRFQAEGCFLGRTIKFVNKVGYEYCPARQHIDNAAAKVGLQEAKPVQAPAVRDH